jgi:hypothetical protein
MPAHTTSLFLLEDLEDFEDVGRTSELAESDLEALQAVADSQGSRPRWDRLSLRARVIGTQDTLACS